MGEVGVCGAGGDGWVGGERAIFQFYRSAQKSVLIQRDPFSSGCIA